MKEMIYKNKREHLKNILDWDIYDNYEYIILNLHSHPCAYVCIDSNNPFYNQANAAFPLCFAERDLSVFQFLLSYLQIVAEA